MKKLLTERRGERKARVAELLDDATRGGLLTLVSARIDEERFGLTLEGVPPARHFRSPREALGECGGRAEAAEAAAVAEVRREGGAPGRLLAAVGIDGWYRRDDAGASCRPIDR